MTKLSVIFCVCAYVFGFELGITKGSNERTSIFAKVVSSPEFVDKTLLIKEVVQHKFISVMSPRLFGKTTNLDMLKTFFEIVPNQDGEMRTNIEKDANGKLVEKSESLLTENFKLFKKHNLNVYRDKEFFYQHCGQHPVIYIDFDHFEIPDRTNAAVFRELTESFSTTVHKVFRHHGYLLNSKTLWTIDGDKEKFSQIWDTNEYKMLSALNIMRGLKFLTELLHKHFNKTVFVLIDNMDSPILKTIVTSSRETEDIIYLITDVVSKLLINNQHVEQAVMHSTTGIANVITMRVGNITQFPFLNNHTFAPFYGFTDTEVKSLLNKFRLDHNIKDIERWYGGYHILGTHDQIFNVFSVVNYLKKSSLQSYWTNQIEIKNLEKIFKLEYVQFMINDLLNNRVICIEMEPKPSAIEVLILQRFLNSPPSSEEVDEKDAWYFIQFLYSIGYFNILHIRIHDGALCLEIPNREIGQQLASKFYSLQYFMNKFHFTMEQVSSYNEALNSLRNSKSTFESLVKSLSELYYTHQIQLPENNIELHRILLMFAKNSSNFHHVYGDIYSKNTDNLVIAVIRNGGTAVLMQVSYKKLSAIEALRQVIKYHLNALDKYKAEIRRDKIYIGLTLDDKRKISVSYLVNSVDINEAIDLKS